jgi:hypothetical protein
VKVRLTDEHLMVVAGGKKLVDEAVDAFKDGKGTLGEEAAHKSAIAALGGSPRAIVWADMGRVGNVFLDFAKDKAKDELREAEKKLGIDSDAIKLTGDDRITAALALTLDSDGAVWNYELVTLNAPALGVIGGASAFMGGFGGIPRAEPVGDSGGGGTSGVAECDAYFAAIARCDSLPAESKRSLEQSAETMRTTLRDGNEATRSAMAGACSQARDSIRSLCP